jgi:hypothetical protein
VMRQSFLSTFNSEITNKNCHVTFLLTPHPPHVIFGDNLTNPPPPPKMSHII